MVTRRLGTLALLTCALALALAGSSRAEEHRALWEPLDVPNVALYPVPKLEAQMFAELNDARVRAGLQPLESEPRLVKLARAYALRMLTKHFIGHVTPDGSTPGSRLKAAGYTFMRSAENLVYTEGDEHRAFQGLNDSPPHRDNMFDARYTKVGIGAIAVSIYSTMYVQEFADE
jgi:uncharacterized protein YkwD